MSKRPHARFFALVTMASLVLFAGGCKHGDAAKKPPRIVDTDSKPQQYEPLATALVKDPRYQPSIKILAEAKGEIVAVQVQNLADKPIGVEPAHFGLVREGEGKVVHPVDAKAATTTFPRLVLERGQIATGNLTFTGMGNAAGQRLVFHHTQVPPSAAYILGEGAPPIAVPRKDVKK